MKKLKIFTRKTVSVILTLALCITLFSAIPLTAEASNGVWSEAYYKSLSVNYPLAEGQVYVGYGMRSIMPLEGMDLPLAGYGNTASRIGIVAYYSDMTNYGYQRELFTTVVAIADAKGNIVLFDTNDLTGCGDVVLKGIRNAITSATGVPETAINVSISHTHSAPDAKSTTSKIKADNDAYNAFLDAQAAEAAKEAISDLRPATMSIDTVGVEVEDGTNLLNFVRHYETTVYDFDQNRVLKSDNHGAWYYYDENMKTSGDWKSMSSSKYDTKNGTNGHTTEADADMQLIKFDRADSNNVVMCNWQSHPHRQGGSSSTIVSADVVGAFRNYMTGQFAAQETGTNNRAVPFVGEKVAEKPVFSGSLTPAQAETEKIRKATFDASSTKNYRFAYFTGAAGNINDSSSNADEGIKAVSDYSGQPSAEKSFRASSLFGKILATYAKKCFDGTDGQGFTTVNGGSVKTKRYTYTGAYPTQENNHALRTARCVSMIFGATKANLRKMIAGTYSYSSTQMGYFADVTEPGCVKGSAEAFTKRIQRAVAANYASSFLKSTTKDASGNYNFSIDNIKATTESTFTQSNITHMANRVATYAVSLDDWGTETRFLVQSPYHASKMAAWYSNSGSNYTAELDAVSVGDVAFTTFPGELFDTNAVFVKENTPYKMNFILGYTNGATGYLPSAYAHLYTTYETNNTITSLGTAEALAGIQLDNVTDLLYSDETYNLSVGETLTISKPNGKSGGLYSYVDGFKDNYTTLGNHYANSTIITAELSEATALNEKLGRTGQTTLKGTDIKYCSFTESSVSWSSSNTAVATVDQNGKITAKGKGSAIIACIRSSGSMLKPNESHDAVYCNIVVGDHVHCDNCGSRYCNVSTHKDHTYTAWTKSTSLPTSGYYYLTKNVVLDSTVSLSDNLHLCLNGYRVYSKSTGGAFTVNGGSLTICDCGDTTGKIDTPNSFTFADGCALINVKSGDFTLFDGAISAQSCTGQYGSALYIASGTSVKLAGGAVLGGKSTLAGGTVYCDGTLNICGGSIGSGTTDGSGGTLYLDKNASFTMTSGSIDGGYSKRSGGTVFTLGKSNTVSGGTIFGGTTETDTGADYITAGGSVYIGKNTTFNFNGGLITGGHSNNGGNIALANNTVLNIGGGTITGGTNTDTLSRSIGGNVYVKAHKIDETDTTDTYNATVNMTGGTITNGTAYGLGGNFYVYGAEAVVNIMNGTVSNGVSYRAPSGSSDGHGGNFFAGGTVNLYGGTVSGGVAYGSGGGNFSVNGANSHLNIMGGTIKNGSFKSTNKTQQRGNVFVWNTAGKDAFNMTGGIITDDSSFYLQDGFQGGGVYIANKAGYDSVLNISGTAEITGNVASNIYDEDNGKMNKTYCNVYLETGKYISVTDFELGSVGVTVKEDVLSTKTPVIIAENAGEFASFFTSDVSNLYIGADASDNLILTDVKPADSDNRPGGPSNIKYLKYSSDNPAASKDSYAHFNIGAASGTFDFASVFNSPAVKKTTSNGYGSLSGTVVTASKVGGTEEFDVTSDGVTTKCVVAMGHYHCVECGTYGCKSHTNYLFTAISKLSEASITSSNKNGHFYVSGNIANDALGIDLNSVAGTSSVCLNGKTVTTTGTGTIADITSVSSKFYITDCSSDMSGTIVAKNTNDSAKKPWLYNMAASSSSFRLYRGNIDGSANPSNYGAGYQNAGTYYIYDGKITLSKKDMGAETAGFNIAGGNFRMKGGIIDGFYAVSNYGTMFRMATSTSANVTLDAGKIICGSVTKAANSTKRTGGNICLIKGNFVINGGIVQDGLARPCEGETRSAGLFYIVPAKSGDATLTLNDGIIANSTCYGIGANIYISTYGKFVMTGGLVTGGKAYQRYGTTGDGHGGNIYLTGAADISGGVVSNGRAFGHGGGNISANGNNSVLTISGDAVIKNGACISSKAGAGNIYIWNNAMSAKTALNMSGGTVTCDDNFIIPNGMSAGGIKIDATNCEYPCIFSGNAKVYGNQVSNIRVSPSHTVKVQSLTEGARLDFTILSPSVIANGVEAASLKYISTDEYSKENFAFAYSSGDKTLYTTQISDIEYKLIDMYMTDGENVYSEVTYENAPQIAAIKGFWDQMTTETQDAVNNYVLSHGSILTAAELIEQAIDISKDSGVNVFVNSYFKDDSTGNYYTAATYDNYASILAAESEWKTYNAAQKNKANSLVGTDIDTLISSAKVFDANLKAVESFVDTYLKSGGKLITVIDFNNCETVAAGRTAYNGFDSVQKAKADAIAGYDVDAFITSAESYSAKITAAKKFVNDNNLKNATVSYANAKAIAALGTEYKTFDSDVKTLIDTYAETDVDALIKSAALTAATLDTATDFVNTYLYKDSAKIKTATVDNYKQILAAKNEYEKLTADQKGATEYVFGGNLQELFDDATVIYQSIAFGETFINDNFKSEGALITAASITNFRTVIEAYEKLSLLEEEQYDSVMAYCADISYDVVGLYNQAAAYKNMLDVTVVKDGKDIRLCSTVDTNAGYKSYGFIIELPRDAIARFTTDTVYALTDDNVKEGVAAIPAVSSVANYAYYTSPYSVYWRDLNKTCVIYSFVELDDGTVVYGDRLQYYLSDQSGNIDVGGKTVVPSGDSGFDDSDFGL